MSKEEIGNGALAQMVAQSTKYQVSDNQAVEDVLPIGKPMNTFQITHSFTIPRQGDTLEELFLEVHVKALPEGYRWRQWAPQRLVESSELTIGGNRVSHTTREAEMMRLYLFQNTMVQESEMEYLDPKKDHTFLRPLSCRKLPLIALQYHEVVQKITLSRLDDLIETESPTMCESPLGYAQLQGRQMYLDTKERRLNARSAFLVPHVTYDTSTAVFDVVEGRVQFDQRQDLVSSATVLHITAEDGRELPEPVVSNLKMRINQLPRQNLTGTVSRIYHREQYRKNVPLRSGWKVRENHLTQNLQYLTHTTGRLDNEQNLQGLNFSRIQSASFDLQMNAAAPPRVRITVLNQTQNILQIMSGMAGLKQQPSTPRFGPFAPREETRGATSPVSSTTATVSVPTANPGDAPCFDGCSVI